MKNFYKRVPTAFLLALGSISLILRAPNWLFIGVVGIVATLIFAHEWPRLFNVRNPLFWLLMPFYPLLPLVLIVIMQLSGYKIINVLIITLAGAHDTGSYITGKLWGKHKISPRISPGKTWEGFAGGVAATFICALIFFRYTSGATMTLALVPLTLIVCFGALAGDLFESSLKRQAGIKDSSHLLPGHGGILDRIDGILVVAIIMYALRDYVTLLFTGAA